MTLKMHGLSLVELIVTIAVAAILYSIAPPLLASFLEASRISGAADLLVTQLHYARTEAIQQSAPMFVTYSMKDTVNWRMGIHDHSQCDTSLSDPAQPDACTIPSSGGRALTVLDGAQFRGIAASANRNATRFDPISGTTLGTNVTISLQSPGGKEIKVIVSNVGRIRTCSPKTAVGKVAGHPPC
ncbi:GspH/FimT family pseudopilin [Aromatoleum aromaticum]|uniref:Type II secretion system protein H n=1 Tax=Aromatoleum aromaticum (strain DSM 19018 / LMG 30748 / EbN1) TaxID=76114 RepID=Q5P0Y3_AROAE|nr:GspH/FimT family pseudopilin [Aromatoleum aromaticum]NMG55797.1 prepilin-type N-terminal cleavage/methylation domain-containing protein [Aromatoleum aromaticum]CAI09031.1 type 4 fimbrial pilin related transmembrane protein similar to FimT protein [Aromatoleum aromaticum EbN1]